MCSVEVFHTCVWNVLGLHKSCLVILPIAFIVIIVCFRSLPREGLTRRYDRNKGFDNIAQIFLHKTKTAFVCLYVCNHRCMHIFLKWPVLLHAHRSGRPAIHLSSFALSPLHCFMDPCTHTLIQLSNVLFCLHICLFFYIEAHCSGNHVNPTHQHWNTHWIIILW